ncbi:MAG: hypothetical protein HN390_08605 [Anaerolineae bacterium]|nr:hypothetical protein [Anaerolineae bacterium]MBT7191046.1 hypothetical protein [Anaerolineae bacterium]MBT7989445.1 hypothetical protein [Anaerolineae bacterium]
MRKKNKGTAKKMIKIIFGLIFLCVFLFVSLDFLLSPVSDSEMGNHVASHVIPMILSFGIAAFLFFWNPVSTADYFKYHKSLYEEPRTPGELNFIRDKKFNKGKYKYELGKNEGLYVYERAAKTKVTEQGIYFYDKTGIRIEQVLFSQIEKIANNSNYIILFDDPDKKYLPGWLISAHKEKIGMWIVNREGMERKTITHSREHPSGRGLVTAKEYFYARRSGGTSKSFMQARKVQ